MARPSLAALILLPPALVLLAAQSVAQAAPQQPAEAAAAHPAQQAVAGALQWLADHQAPDGSWEPDAFMSRDRYADSPSSDGSGLASLRVGTTGLVLLAFIGDGHGLLYSPHSETVARGAQYLLSTQREDGLFGDEIGNATLYGHALATMAIGELYYDTHHVPSLRKPLQSAVTLLLESRNNYAAWRHTLKPNGDNDTSVTGLAVCALLIADDCKITVDELAFAGAESWFSSMEDRNTGRVGYAWGDGGGGPGGPTHRPANRMASFPPEKSEALTAVTLLCRTFMAAAEALPEKQRAGLAGSAEKQIALIEAKPPRWDREGSVDFYYWYFATQAMKQVGGPRWSAWDRAMQEALLPNQRRDSADGKDNFTGSWDPADVWGAEGGRLYSTALAALILELSYREQPVLGAR